MRRFKTLRLKALQWLEDNQGTFALVWALCLTVIILAVGCVVDSMRYYQAKQLAQVAADSLALQASAAVDKNESSRPIAGKQYKFSEIAGPTHDFTGDLKASVEYDVPDGDDTLIARATVSGRYNTLFMAAFGHENLPVTAVSDVTYSQIDGTPASVFFVVDNSGSMGYLDKAGIRKSITLKQNLQSFMVKLTKLQAGKKDDIFRTALYPFSADPDGYYSDIDDDGLIPKHVVHPKWGILTANAITRMQDRSGTDSSGALGRAKTAFPDEGAAHTLVNGEGNPLKFLVFMSDGANNTSTECTTTRIWVNDPSPEYWWRIKNGYRRVKYSKPKNERRWTYQPPTDGYYEDREECETDYFFDQRSLAHCTDMKNQGVSIYTIAYDVAAAQKAHAEQFLLACSSGVDYFKSVARSEELEQAFDEIGEEIVEEVIRIKR